MAEPVYKTVRKFLHKDDGYLYTTPGVLIPILSSINANLTGPITSVGNATSVASQTGTGSTFVMNTAPTLAGFTNSAGLICNTTRVTSGPYTVLATDHIIFCDTDGGAFTANLPAGVEGTHYKLINCGANTLTVNPNGVEELFGAGAGVVSTLAEGEIIDIHYNATEGWY